MLLRVSVRRRFRCVHRIRQHQVIDDLDRKMEESAGLIGVIEVRLGDKKMGTGDTVTIEFFAVKRRRNGVKARVYLRSRKGDF